MVSAVSYGISHTKFSTRYYTALEKLVMNLTAYTQVLQPPVRLVLETLEPLSGDRKCFRLINGVLVQRTVQDVVPALKTNQEGLKKVLDDLVKQYKTKQDELDKWKVSSLMSYSPSPCQVQITNTVCCRKSTISRLFGNNALSI